MLSPALRPEVKMGKRMKCLRSGGVMVKSVKLRIGIILLCFEIKQKHSSLSVFPPRSINGSHSSELLEQSDKNPVGGGEVIPAIDLTGNQSLF